MLISYTGAPKVYNSTIEQTNFSLILIICWLRMNLTIHFLISWKANWMTESAANFVSPYVHFHLC